MTYQTQRKKHVTYPWETLEQRFNEKGLPRDVLGFVRENGVPDNLITEACRLLMGIRFDSTHGEIETKNGIDQFDILAEIVPNETQRPYAIYKVQDRKTQSIYVIKISKPDSSDDDRDRLAIEAKFYQNLYSENICHCFSHNYSFRDGKKAEFFLLMEYIDGKPLSAFIERKRQLTHDRMAEVLKIAKGIAKGLSAAHKQDKIHRDVKPENVVLTEKKLPKLIDFGIATKYSTNQPAAGTHGYLSPEQARGESVTTKTDIFSFGIILWEMLSGDKLFPVHDRNVYLESIRCWSGPPAPGSCISGIHPNIAELLTLCLCADPAARPSADSIVKTIDEHLAVFHSNDLDRLCTYRDLSNDIANDCHIEFSRLSEVVDDWVSNDLPGRLLTITGATGDGKTSFVCKWATQRMSQFPFMLWLCCNEGDKATQTTCNPTVFVAEFIRFLKTNIPAFNCDDGIDTELLKHSPVKALERYCLAPLASLNQSLESHKCIIIIDNVKADDGGRFEHQVSLTEVVKVLDNELPRSFKIIQTCLLDECVKDASCLDLGEQPKNDRFSLSFSRKAALEVGQWFLDNRPSFLEKIDAQLDKTYFGSGETPKWAQEMRRNSQLMSVISCRKLNALSMSDWCQQLLEGSLKNPFAWGDYIPRIETERLWKDIWDVSPDAMNHSELFSVLNVLAQPLPLQMLKKILPIWPTPFEKLFHLFEESATNAIQWKDVYKVAASQPNRVHFPDETQGHIFLVEACKKIIDNPYAASEECREFSFNNYGLHLLGAGMMAEYERWLFGSDREDFFKTRLLDSCMAIKKEYRLLDRDNRTDYILENKNIANRFINAGIECVAEHYSNHWNRAGGITADLSDIMHEVVTDVVQFKKTDKEKLFVFGSIHSGDINGAGPDVKKIYEPIWEHPLWKDIEKAHDAQADRIIRVYAEIFRLATEDFPYVVSNPMYLMASDGRLGGFINFFHKELRMTWLCDQKLSWVNGYFSGVLQDCYACLMKKNETLNIHEIKLTDENLADSTVDEMLTILFILSRGWTPLETELPKWLDGPWVMNALPNSESSDGCINIIEKNGDQEALDEFKSAFRRRHLTDEFELGPPLYGNDYRQYFQ